MGNGNGADESFGSLKLWRMPRAIIHSNVNKSVKLTTRLIFAL